MCGVSYPNAGADHPKIGSLGRALIEPSALYFTPYKAD